MAALRPLQVMSPWPGLHHLMIRVPIQLTLIGGALRLWANGQYAAFAGVAVLSALWYASLLCLTHDALHCRLTGVRRLDAVAGRMIAWPLFWPVGIYKPVHLMHHKLNGSDPIQDPERVTPLPGDWHGSAFQRICLRHPLVIGMATGGLGQLWRLLKAARLLPAEGRAGLIVFELSGCAVTFAAMAGAGWLCQGALGLWAVICLWLIHAQIVGAIHSWRAHAEHYGVWEARDTWADTQWHSARTIDTHPMVSLYFNRLNHHAAHHVNAAIPFYKLARATALIRAAAPETVVTSGYRRAVGDVAQAVQAKCAIAREGDRIIFLRETH
ncbi:fatty acid desaturase [Asticcacaulis sp. BYS171W]|uniref:Fatty acid desaturase n=1 Tax=Asticcacaulis aquaticus TaxID=2984212 RepID=A0ABT5HUI6_9CAUL|nr:fatty acid desaturase [Asticcacaulis aquaticus]MDC7683731.1 fatty acid desaturase [Asticcacaulis aquaticus]